MHWRIILLLFTSLMTLLACNLGITPPAQVSATDTAHPPTSAPQSTPTTHLPTPAPILPFERTGAMAITLLTPQEGVGTHPKFEWQPAPGAARYTLLLTTADNQPYWAWEGSETFVYLGGDSKPPPEDSPGPILLRPMQWQVLAFDAEGKLIGYSEIRPIAP